MIIDINATLGHYPFRQLVATTPASMIALMDRWTVDRALVSSLHAVFYRDAHRGNRELFEHVRAHPDRFIGVATINPKYVGWRDDLDECIEKMQTKAVTLVPAHHGYSLTDSFAQEAIKEIAKRGLPLLLAQRFEDRRQRHHWDIAEDLEQATVLELGKQHPDLRIILSNWIALDGTKLAAAGWKGRVLLDFARLHVLLHGDVGKLIDTIGVDAIAFGSHMPFDYTAASLVKLSNLDTLSEDEQSLIAWRNAANFLNLSDIKGK